MEFTRFRDQNELQLAKLRLVIESTNIVLWDMEVVKDDPVNDSNAVEWTDELRHLLGFTDEKDFPNRFGSLHDCLHHEDGERAVNALKSHLLDTSGRTPFNIEVRLKHKGGEYGYYHATGETLRDKDGMPIHVAGAVQDITETKKILHENELQLTNVKNLIIEAEKQRISAETANKAKSDFLSTMSHEIRTPMNAILGITEIQLQNKSLDKNMREAFERIYASSDLLMGIINNILDLSKIEAGQLELSIAAYQTASMISDSAQLNILRIGSKPINFILSVDENLPVQLLGDELRVRQILNNLLSNAFKYTTAGMVRLSVFAETKGAADNEIMLNIVVSDTGQGMTREQIDKMFDEYSRFNTEANRLTEGTGLGMGITRNLIQLMNGEINVESEPGKGSVFTVRIPQGRNGSGVLGREIVENLRYFRATVTNRAQMKRAQITRDPMPYGSVLVVDDVETNIYVARGLMTPYGLKIDTADSGFAAIDKIKNGSVYDIVFMDHMMPKMDGIEAVKIIRSMGYKNPIVALTANAVIGQADMFLKNGFDDYIPKPLDIRKLNAILNKLIRDKQPPEIVEEARRQAAEKKTK